MPELRHLRYFIAVAEELNFSRAARRLRMAQPPLSVAIRQLEAELGTELFRRSSREVTLTEAGNALLAGARRTLAEADGAVAAAKRAAAGELGGLRIGFSWSARFDTLPVLGQAFRLQRPDVELLTEEMWNSRMTSALRDGTIDVAVALCPEVAGDLTSARIRGGDQSQRARGRRVHPFSSRAGPAALRHARRLLPACRLRTDRRQGGVPLGVGAGRARRRPGCRSNTGIGCPCPPDSDCRRRSRRTAGTSRDQPRLADRDELLDAGRIPRGCASRIRYRIGLALDLIGRTRPEPPSVASPERSGRGDP
jgi:DNA-binding transcriptional LysR family regulator